MNYQEMSNGEIETRFKWGEIKLFRIVGINGKTITLHVPVMGKRPEKDITVNFSPYNAGRLKVGDQVATVYAISGHMTMTQPVAVVPQEGEPWRIKP